MQGAEVLTRFKADTKDFDSKTKTVNASIGSIAKGVLAATGVTKALSMAWSSVTKNMDTAIDRFDTLNNFSKVMKNLGINTEESQEAIDTLSDKLLGLPTTLQDGAMAVQRLTAKNGDIKKSTNLFLAMNNAILAGGAPMSNQQAALEQLSQAYAKGKPDMMEWRTMMTAMPAQLKQVATAMGYVDADALGTALREGSVSMDDFMDTIVKLNTEGVNGLANFEEQARAATGGIRTAITNMNSRIAAGVSEMIGILDNALKNTPIGGLAKMIEGIGSDVKSKLVTLGNVLAPILEELFGNERTFAEKGEILSSSISKMVLIGIQNLNAKLPDFIKNFMQTLTGIIKGLTPYLPLIIKSLVEGLVLIITALAEQLPDIIPVLVEAILGIIPVLIESLPLFIEAGAKLLAGLIEGIIKSIPTLVDKTKEIGKKIRETLRKIDLVQIGKDILKGLWNGMVGIKDWVIEKVKGIGKSILKGLRGVLGIKSPSKEFAIIGRYSILGYTEALDDMQSDVQKQVAETFAISPQLSATSGMHFSPNIINNNYVDIQQDPLGQMVNSIKTYSGGAKNDFNYGAGL